MKLRYPLQSPQSRTTTYLLAVWNSRFENPFENASNPLAHTHVHFTSRLCASQSLLSTTVFGPVTWNHQIQQYVYIISLLWILEFLYSLDSCDTHTICVTYKTYDDMRTCADTISRGRQVWLHVFDVHNTQTNRFPKKKSYTYIRVKNRCVRDDSNI